MDINIPDEVRFIIDRLEKSGYEAYAVGGCVRDALMGEKPKDWDICTSALPEQTIRCFEGYRVIETGLKHGTIALVLDKKPFEITTYRVDGVYSDNRRPDNVEFVSDLREDLSRRDFTINAIAYHPDRGVIDYFDGVSDIRARVIRCVGVADTRFREDALRIMRALRFASVLGFYIEDETAGAIFKNKSLLKNIAVERFSAELGQLLVGSCVARVLAVYAPVLEEIIPELQGVSQSSMWMQTLEGVAVAPADATLRLTMLLHGIVGSGCATGADTGADTERHDCAYSQADSTIVNDILSRLKYDNNTINAISELVLYYYADIQPGRIQVKRWLNRIGEERFRQLLTIQRADAMTQSEDSHHDRMNVQRAETGAEPEEHRCVRLKVLDDVESVLDEIIRQHQCYSLSDLVVNGDDLLAAGMPEGVEVGLMLNRLLELVIDESIPNNREVLLKKIKEVT